MVNESPHPETESADEAWQQIDALVEEIASLSKADLPPGDFYAEFLGRVVSALAALGGVVWSQGPSGRLQVDRQILPAEGRLVEGDPNVDQHRRLAAQVLQSGQPQLVPPHCESAGGDQTLDPGDYLLLLCPWNVEGGLAGVVEVFQRPGTSPKAQRGFLRFLEVVCEFVAEFHRRVQLRDLRRRAAEWQRWEQFTERAHGSLDLRVTAYTIANAGRQWIGCDRASVLVRRGSKFQLAAVSGVETFNRRAAMVRPLERLAKAAALFDEPLWHPVSTGDRSPEIDEMLGAYADESHARVLAVIPLKPPQPDEGAPRAETVGVLVAEWFQGTLDEGLRKSLAGIGGHAALALANAMELENLPLARLLRGLGRARWFVEARQLPKTVLVLLALAAAVAAMIVVPAELRIEARGELQPLATHDVFAPADAVVAELRTAHAEQVGVDQVLLVLRHPELDFELKRVGGELQTARQKLHAVETEQLLAPRDAGERRRPSQLTAQQEELRERINSLAEQQAILRREQAELEVRSPLAGQVLTWNLEQLLQARPVNRGQVLLTVADLAGPWGLELRIPDHRIAHVLDSQAEIGPDLEVAFVLATDPGRTLRGRIERVGMRTEVAESEGPFVLARVAIDRDQIPELMPGATVTARISCGRRALGYVWLHELIDAIQSWLAF